MNPSESALKLDLITPFQHFHRLEKKAIVTANKEGDLAITEFLATERLGTKEQPITCTLYPRRRGTKEYIFEISPQLGCAIGCNFCGCGKLKGNLKPNEIVEQIDILKNDAIQNGIDIKKPKISFSDGGELLLNPYCLQILETVSNNISADIKISSTLPDVPLARKNMKAILEFAQKYYSKDRNVMLQISLLSTDPNIRQKSSHIPLLSFADIRTFGEKWVNNHPANRKITITFTLTNESHYVASEIKNELPPSLFLIRLHPYHPNGTGLTIINDENYSKIERDFLKLNYEVIFKKLDEHESNQLITGGTNSIRKKINNTVFTNS